MFKLRMRFVAGFLAVLFILMGIPWTPLAPIMNQPDVYAAGFGNPVGSGTGTAKGGESFLNDGGIFHRCAYLYTVVQARDMFWNGIQSGDSGSHIFSTGYPVPGGADPSTGNRGWFIILDDIGIVTKDAGDKGISYGWLDSSRGYISAGFRKDAAPYNMLVVGEGASPNPAVAQLKNCINTDSNIWRDRKRIVNADGTTSKWYQDLDRPINWHNIADKSGNGAWPGTVQGFIEAPHDVGGIAGKITVPANIGNVTIDGAKFHTMNYSDYYGSNYDEATRTLVMDDAAVKKRAENALANCLLLKAQLDWDVAAGGSHYALNGITNDQVLQDCFNYWMGYQSTNAYHPILEDVVGIKINSFNQAGLVMMPFTDLLTLEGKSASTVSELKVQPRFSWLSGKQPRNSATGAKAEFGMNTPADTVKCMGYQLMYMTGPSVGQTSEASGSYRNGLLGQYFLMTQEECPWQGVSYPAGMSTSLSGRQIYDANALCGFGTIGAPPPGGSAPPEDAEGTHTLLATFPSSTSGGSYGLGKLPQTDVSNYTWNNLKKNQEVEKGNECTPAATNIKYSIPASTHEDLAKILAQKITDKGLTASTEKPVYVAMPHINLKVKETDNEGSNKQSSTISGKGSISGNPYEFKARLPVQSDGGASGTGTVASAIEYQEETLIDVDGFREAGTISWVVATAHLNSLSLKYVQGGKIIDVFKTSHANDILKNSNRDVLVALELKAKTSKDDGNDVEIINVYKVNNNDANPPLFNKSTNMFEYKVSDLDIVDPISDFHSVGDGKYEWSYITLNAEHAVKSLKTSNTLFSNSMTSRWSDSIGIKYEVTWSLKYDNAFSAPHSGTIEVPDVKPEFAKNPYFAKTVTHTPTGGSASITSFYGVRGTIPPKNDSWEINDDPEYDWDDSTGDLHLSPYAVFANTTLTHKEQVPVTTNPDTTGDKNAGVSTVVTNGFKQSNISTCKITDNTQAETLLKNWLDSTFSAEQLIGGDPLAINWATFEEEGTYSFTYESEAQGCFQIQATEEDPEWDLNNLSYLDDPSGSYDYILDLDTSQDAVYINVIEKPIIAEWHNNPAAFAEIKQGSFTTNRSSETYDVMTGVPTSMDGSQPTDLYINVGGTPLFFGIQAELKAGIIHRDWYINMNYARTKHWITYTPKGKPVKHCSTANKVTVPADSISIDQKIFYWNIDDIIVKPVEGMEITGEVIRSRDSDNNKTAYLNLFDKNAGVTGSVFKWSGDNGDSLLADFGGSPSGFNNNNYGQNQQATYDFKYAGHDVKVQVDYSLFDDSKCGDESSKDDKESMSFGCTTPSGSFTYPTGVDHDKTSSAKHVAMSMFFEGEQPWVFVNSDSCKLTITVDGGTPMEYDMLTGYKFYGGFGRGNTLSWVGCSCSYNGSKSYTTGSYTYHKSINSIDGSAVQFMSKQANVLKLWHPSDLDSNGWQLNRWDEEYTIPTIGYNGHPDISTRRNFTYNPIDQSGNINVPQETEEIDIEIDGDEGNTVYSTNKSQMSPALYKIPNNKFKDNVTPSGAQQQNGYKTIINSTLATDLANGGLYTEELKVKPQDAEASTKVKLIHNKNISGDIHLYKAPEEGTSTPEYYQYELDNTKFTDVYTLENARYDFLNYNVYRAINHPYNYDGDWSDTSGTEDLLPIAGIACMPYFYGKEYEFTTAGDTSTVEDKTTVGSDNKVNVDSSNFEETPPIDLSKAEGWVYANNNTRSQSYMFDAPDTALEYLDFRDPRYTKDDTGQYGSTGASTYGHPEYVTFGDDECPLEGPSGGSWRLVRCGINPIIIYNPISVQGSLVTVSGLTDQRINDSGKSYKSDGNDKDKTPANYIDNGFTIHIDTTIDYYDLGNLSLARDQAREKTDKEVIPDAIKKNASGLVWSNMYRTAVNDTYSDWSTHKTKRLLNGDAHKITQRVGDSYGAIGRGYDSSNSNKASLKLFDESTPKWYEGGTITSTPTFNYIDNVWVYFPIDVYVDPSTTYSELSGKYIKADTWVCIPGTNFSSNKMNIHCYVAPSQEDVAAAHFRVCAFAKNGNFTKEYQESLVSGGGGFYKLGRENMSKQLQYKNSEDAGKYTATGNYKSPAGIKIADDALNDWMFKNTDTTSDTLFETYAKPWQYSANLIRYSGDTAAHTANKEFIVDIVGRIGNVAADDSEDPRYEEYFRGSKSQFYSQTKDIFDNKSRFIDHVSTLQQWFAKNAEHVLPVGSDRPNQKPKLGYGVNFTIQTIGSYFRQGPNTSSSSSDDEDGGGGGGSELGDISNLTVKPRYIYHHANGNVEEVSSMYYNSGNNQYQKIYTKGDFNNNTYTITRDISTTRSKVNYNDPGSGKREATYWTMDESNNPVPHSWDDGAYQLSSMASQLIKLGNPAKLTLGQYTSYNDGYLSIQNVSEGKKMFDATNSVIYGDEAGTTATKHVTNAEARNNHTRWTGTLRLPSSTVFYGDGNKRIDPQPGDYITVKVYARTEIANSDMSKYPDTTKPEWALSAEWFDTPTSPDYDHRTTTTIPDPEEPDDPQEGNDTSTKPKKDPEPDPDPDKPDKYVPIIVFDVYEPSYTDLSIVGTH